MSLSPFDSFQSRFETYLLNFPRITQRMIPAWHQYLTNSPTKHAVQFQQNEQQHSCPTHKSYLNYIIFTGIVPHINKKQDIHSWDSHTTSSLLCRKS